MHQLVGMGEMREKIYLNFPSLPHLPHLPYLPYLPHLHSRQKDQLLMTTPPLTPQQHGGSVKYKHD